LEKDSWSRQIRKKTPQVQSDCTEFDSPLVVKVKNVVETHRREEVDLETGRRRSWIETENKELIDITGDDSPVQAPTKKLTEIREIAAKKKINMEAYIAVEQIKEKPLVEKPIKKGKEKTNLEAINQYIPEEHVTETILVKKPSEKGKKKTAVDKPSEKSKGKATVETAAVSRKPPTERGRGKTIVEKTSETTKGSSSVAEAQHEKSCSVCSRLFKGDRGLQMHLARSTCGKQVNS